MATLQLSSHLIPDSLKSLKISLINGHVHSKIIYSTSHTCIAIFLSMSTCVIKALQFKGYLINNTTKDMMRKMYMASLQKDSANIYLPFTSLDLSVIFMFRYIITKCLLPYKLLFMMKLSLFNVI